MGYEPIAARKEVVVSIPYGSCRRHPLGGLTAEEADRGFRALAGPGLDVTTFSDPEPIYSPEIHLARCAYCRSIYKGTSCSQCGATLKEEANGRSR